MKWFTVRVYCEALINKVCYCRLQLRKGGKAFPFRWKMVLLAEDKFTTPKNLIFIRHLGVFKIGHTQLRNHWRRRRVDMKVWPSVSSKWMQAYIIDKAFECRFWSASNVKEPGTPFFRSLFSRCAQPVKSSTNWQYMLKTSNNDLSFSFFGDLESRSDATLVLASTEHPCFDMWPRY